MRRKYSINENRVRNNTYIVCPEDNEVKKANVNLLHVIKKVEEKIRMIRKVMKDN